MPPKELFTVKVIHEKVSIECYGRILYKELTNVMKGKTVKHP